MTTTYLYNYKNSKSIPSRVEELFAFVDDPMQFSAHMGESSWMMAGSEMRTSVDEGGGKKIGSHIRMSGKVLGIKLFLDEVVTHREPPRIKTWETVGSPKLLIIGDYRMHIEIEPRGESSLLCVFIEYNLPDSNAWLGKLFGGFYAKWCVEQMIDGAFKHFA